MSEVGAAVDAAGARATSVVVTPRLRWWFEVLLVGVLYLVYSSVRNLFGSDGGPLGQANGIAYGHALDVIRVQEAMGLFFEPQVQDWYLSLPREGLIGFWNVFYGTAHFIVTGAALVLCYRKAAARYPLWRNTLVFTTLLALIGFAGYSLMPPRLLDVPQERYGPPAELVEREFGFVDTLAEYETFWSFDDGPLEGISNQYAAMPSLHAAWSTWSAFVLVPMVRRRWAKGLVVAHPLATLFCIVVTANHFWLDAVGGLVTLAAGYGVAVALGRGVGRWRARDAASHAVAA